MLKLSGKEVFGKARELLKINWKFFAAAVFVAWLIYMIPGVLGEFSRARLPILALMLGVASTVLALLMEMGLIGLALRVFDGREKKIANLFTPYRLFWKYLGAYAIFVVVASIFFAIAAVLYTYLPLVLWVFVSIAIAIAAVIFTVTFQFFGYSVIDKGLGPVQAFKASAELTKGNRKQILILDLVLAGVNVIGALLFVVGLLITIPFTFLTLTSAYRFLSAEGGYNS